MYERKSWRKVEGEMEKRGSGSSLYRWQWAVKLNPYVYEMTIVECGFALYLVWSNHRLPSEKNYPAIIPARQIISTCVMLDLSHVQLQSELDQLIHEMEN